MDVKKLQLRSFGRFKSLDIYIAPTQTIHSNVTVFIGSNGAGKTTILTSIATSLSWLVARIRRENGVGSHIPEEKILNGESLAALKTYFSDKARSLTKKEGETISHDYEMILTRARKGTKKHASKLQHITELADQYRTAFTEDEQANFPLLAYYSVERVVLDIPLKIKTRHTFQQLDGYDNSLNQGVDFRRFFEWFRQREDAENETSLSSEILNRALNKFGQDSQVWKALNELGLSERDRQLTAVRTAIQNFMNDFRNLRVRRKPRLHMAIDKNGETLNVNQLSQGEKSLLALVGDVARRLAMMNPSLENPLAGDGIVLIDEVDMHLHPSWQRNIIERLKTTFPNCQFILTTHSPLVISDCKDVLVYSLDDGELTEIPSQYGQDANTVLVDVMDTPSRNLDIAEQLDDLQDAIFSNKLDEAKVLLDDLKSQLPQDNFELIRARHLLRKQELRNEKNRKDRGA